MRAGAFDFVTKPWDNTALINSIHTALALRAPKAEENLPLNRLDADRRFHFENIIGRSDALMRVLGTVSRIASTHASVLITGENGTGKELIAEAIHANSPRAGQPFVKVNLGGVSHSLFESEMFGHRKGAFTDAYSDRTGRFEMADGGTIFLDEIGDLDMSCQVKLLRVLQDRTFEVLGDSRPRKVDVRIVSATNADLKQMIAGRTFREDLFYRINLITVHLPPLRERKDDIPLLARYFADCQAQQNNLPKVDFTRAAYDYLCRLPYPGNVRELKNLVERTLLISGKTLVDADDIRELAGDKSSPALHRNLSPDGLTLDELEKQSILRALDKNAGNLSHAARDLGISRAALYRRIEKYGIRTDG
jgi:two-component system NtrC family response regulator